MKTLLLPLTIASVTIAWAMAPAAAPEMQRLDGIAAVVGDEVILVSEVEAYMLMRLNEMKVRPDSAGMPSLRKQFLDEIIEGKVLLAHARQDTTIRVRPDEVDGAMDDHIKHLLQENNLTQDQLEKELAAQGMTVGKFRQELRRTIEEQLLRRNVHQRYLATLDVTRLEVENFYKTYRDSLPALGESYRLLKLTINVPTPDSVRQAAYERARKVKTKIDNGEKFEDLARLYSDDASASGGGDLGWVAKGTLSEIAFEEAAFALAPGQVSDLVETHLGFHLVKVEGKRDQKVKVRQILIRVNAPERLQQEVAARLDSIRASVKTAAQFVDAVHRFSTDDRTRSRDGDMGWIPALQMPAVYKASLDTLASGQTGKPFNDEAGLTILFVKDHSKDRPVTLEDDYDLLAAKAKDIMAQQKLSELVKRWRKDVYIDIRLQ